MRWLAVGALALVLCGCGGEDPQLTERTCAQVRHDASERLDELERSGKDPQRDERMLALTSEILDRCG